MTIKIEKKIIGWRVAKKSEIITDSNAPKRPAEIACEIHKANIKGEKWTILIGLLNGRPYEVMGGLSAAIEIPDKYKDGILIKNLRKTMPTRYDLKLPDETIIKDVVSVFDNPSYGTLTRMISMSLRHGVPMQFIVEQLQKDKYSDIFSFSKVIARVLKKYVQDGTKGGGGCEECGSSNLIYQGGCPICQDCGYSKCG